MKNSITFYASGLLLVSGLVLQGCVTTTTDNQRAVYERENRREFQETLRKYSGRIENLEMETEQLRRQLEELRSKLVASQDTQQALVSDFENQINKINELNTRNKAEIIENLTKKITQMLKSTPRQTRPEPKKRNISEFGVEHTVEAGQTLGAIAQAYGVKMAVIAEANNLKDPYKLRIGQKLFIPE